jgi:hypothetical protein
MGLLDAAFALVQGEAKDGSDNPARCCDVGQ